MNPMEIESSRLSHAFNKPILILKQFYVSKHIIVRKYYQTKH